MILFSHSFVKKVVRAVCATTNHLFTAQSPELFAYDADGNLTQDGRFTYTWNAENRLIKAETRDDLNLPSLPRHRVEYAYDHQGRMVWKEVSDVSKNCKLKTVNYLWDNWNIISETSVSTTPNSELLTSNSTHYVWGLDLSGTLQGAGGVGGLLAVIREDGVFAPAYDANGNITEDVSLTTNHYPLTTSPIAAHYEYDPFGNIVAQSGDLADTFAFRFSTKPYETETAIVHYERRPYSPPLGRFICSDPIGERGGLNLYGVAGNNAVNWRDMLGMSAMPWGDGFPFPQGGGETTSVPDYYFPTESLPLSQHYVDAFLPMPPTPVFSATGGEQHYGKNQHENYIVFYVTCPKCETAVGIQPDYSEVASCLRDNMWFGKTNFDEFARVQGLGGSVKDYPQPSVNCKGEPLEMRVFMRTRFVNDDYLSSWTGTQALLERTRRGFPSPEVGRSCYEKTKLKWQCAPCEN